MKLIDRDNIRIAPEYMENIFGTAMIRVEDLHRILMAQPIAKQQNETGEWVGEEHWFMCSECNSDCPFFFTDWNYKQVRTEYCPHCGAKMKNCE